MWTRKRQRNNKQDRYIKAFSRKLSSKHVDLYKIIIFVDLTKAFDSVCRGGLWKIMAKFGRPAKVHSNGVAIFHDGMQPRVQNDGE